MPHIHTEPGQHDTTVSAIIIREDYIEPRVLLHMHKKLGYVVHFGGHVELHETPWQALVHEVTEETGYELGQLTLLQPKDRIATMAGAILHPVPFASNTHSFPGLSHSHSDSTFAFVTDQEPANLPADGESLDLRSFSYAELEGLRSSGTPDNVITIAQFALQTCLPNFARVSPYEFER